MKTPNRHSTGVAALDDLLGGGLLPGKLTVVAGATGIGKSQLGVQFANAGQQQETRRGIFFDMSARGDAQGHTEYAERIHQWSLSVTDSQKRPALDDFFDPDRTHGDYLHVFDYRGRRVTRKDLDWDDWQQWQAEINQKLGASIAFLYGNFVQGCRRIVIDGLEPADRPNESIQLTCLNTFTIKYFARTRSGWLATCFERPIVGTRPRRVSTSTIRRISVV